MNSTVRVALLGDIGTAPVRESTAYQCVVDDELVCSSALTAPLMSNSMYQWWGPGAHVICSHLKSSSGRRQLSVGLTLESALQDRLMRDEELGKGIVGDDEVGAKVDTTPKGKRLQAIEIRAATEQRTRASIPRMLAALAPFEKRVKDLVSMIRPQDAFYWQLAHLPTLSAWHAPNSSCGGRVILLGDSAYAMVPHFGQGSAMGFDDGGCLGESVARAAALPNSIGVANTIDATEQETDRKEQSLRRLEKGLTVYERVRKSRCEKVMAAAIPTGITKGMKEGESKKRDASMKERLDKRNVGEDGYKFWRASGGLAWIYGWNFQKEGGHVLPFWCPRME